jgi:hypothetical protein
VTTAEMTSAPGRSYEQRIAALREANRIRMYRSQVKRRIKAGTQSATALLIDPPADLATMKALDLLLATPSVGRVRANRALTRCRISPSKTLGGMTDRQRRELLQALPPYQPVVRPGAGCGGCGPVGT